MQITKKAVRKAAEVRKKSETKAKRQKEVQINIPPQDSIQVEVVHGNALACAGDVLALKYAQQRYGVDARVAELFRESGRMFPEPKEGKAKILDSHGCVASGRVLVVGTSGPWGFKYPQIEQWAFSSLSELTHVKPPPVQHLVITPHGAGFGLNPVSAFDSLLNGLQLAVERAQFPMMLKRISIAVLNPDDVKIFRKRVLIHFPDGVIGGGARAIRAPLPKKHPPAIFVAMPFKPEKEMGELYARGILEGVRKVKSEDGRSLFDCERSNPRPGEVILDEIRRRIDNAKYVIADFTATDGGKASNPNVCFEAGYAFKSKGDKRVVPIARKGTEMPSNFKGVFVLFYRDHQHLADELRETLLSWAKENGDI